MTSNVESKDESTYFRRRARELYQRPREVEIDHRGAVIKPGVIGGMPGAWVPAFVWVEDLRVLKEKGK